MNEFYYYNKFAGQKVQIEIWHEISLIHLLNWLKTQNREIQNFYEHFNSEGYENPLYPIYVSVDGDFDWSYETEPTIGYEVLNYKDIVFSEFEIRTQYSVLQHKYNRLESDTCDIVKSWCDLEEFKKDTCEKSLEFINKYKVEYGLTEPFNKNNAAEVMERFWQIVEAIEEDKEWLESEYYQKY